MAYTFGQRVLAEFVGTFALLLFGGGAAVLSLPLLGVFGDALARTVLVSAAFGLTVLGVAYALGEVSGAHLNPAVTLSMWLSGRTSARDAGGYLLAQVVGGLVGILTVAGIAYGSSAAWSSAQGSALASQCYAASFAPAGCGYSLGSVFLIELVLTFVFVLVIQRVTRPSNPSGNLAPLAIGLTLMVTNLVAIPVDGASINPVRSFSPALVSAMWGSAQWAVQESWVFWVAPVLGGLLAAVVERTWSRP